ncbi:MAG: bifunctional 5,10-methylenetetrahydrofolate dehydrogenase/5,10-methenyltetrahydrofolate cyclohydrolase [Flavobacteriales bacterium]
MQILDGKKTSEEIRNEIAVDVKEILKNKGKIPHLAAILVGSNGASVTYVNAKIKACHEAGIKSSMVRLSDTVSEKELLEKIQELNNDDDVDGFIVQLPLPAHINENKIINAVKPEKDVDGFHPENVGRMALNLPGFLPATPYGIIQLIQRYNIETTGKHCVVVGRSHIVGLPMSILMGRNAYPGNCTVTLTHSRTVNFNEICKTADILIVALGKPNHITADMVKEGVTIIDVGITRVPDGSHPKGYRIVGDVDFESVKSKCAFLTPVPGGVGPMTIASLLKNTLLASKMK